MSACAPWCARDGQHWHCQLTRPARDADNLNRPWASLGQVVNGLYDDGMLIIAPQPEPRVMVGRDTTATSFSLSDAENNLVPLLRLLGHGDLAAAVAELVTIGQDAR